MTPDSSRDADSSATSLERRKALLGALGKGSVVLAASAPLKALATGRVVAPNGGQCTISGNGSILGSHTVNNATTNPCGIYGPAALITVDPNQTRSEIVTATGLGQNDLNSLLVGAVLAASNGKLVVKTSSSQGNSNDRFELVSQSSESWAGVAVTATYFGSLGAASTLTLDRLLYGLYAGTRPGVSLPAAAAVAAWFAAAYIAAGSTALPPTGRYKVPFDRNYVSAAWTGGSASAAAAFFASII